MVVSKVVLVLTQPCADSCVVIITTQESGARLREPGKTLLLRESWMDSETLS